MPGVTCPPACSTHTPLSGSTWSEPAVPAGRPLPERDNAIFVGAGPDFFRDACGFRSVAGREFTDRDAATQSRRRDRQRTIRAATFPDQNPVGQRLSTKLNGTPRELQIVGIVKNTNTRSLRAAPPATVYVAVRAS